RKEVTSMSTAPPAPDHTPTEQQERAGQDEPLTLGDVADLAEILRAARSNASVARLVDDGHVLYGVARSIGHANGSFAGRGDDVRDLFLRVTLSSGLEAFWPVQDLMPEVRHTTFVVDYQP